MKYKIAAMAGGTAVVLALAAGCSGSNSSGSGGTALKLSPVAEIQAALTKANNDKTVTVNGTISSAQGSGTLSGQERFGSDFGMSMSISLSGQQIQEVWVGDTIYIKIPQLAQELGGKPWASLDLASLGTGNNIFSSLVDEVKTSDPAQQLQSLLASGDLKSMGTETVNGEQTTHYHGTVDPTTALTSSTTAKNLTSAQIAQLKSLFNSIGLKNEVMDVWIDGQGLPVKEQVVDTTNLGKSTAVMNLSGWGQPVSITAPPSSQVSSINSLMNGVLPSTS
jgi:hypothetical protein